MTLDILVVKARVEARAAGTLGLRPRKLRNDHILYTVSISGL
jgi:hypothetical protein